MIVNLFINSAIWNSVGDGIYMLSNIFVLYFVSFYLSPSDFGIVAICNSILAIVIVLTKNSLIPTIINKKNINNKTIETLISSSLVIGATLFAIVFYASEYVSDFYANKIYKSILILLSIGITLNLLESISIGVLTKELKFKFKSKLLIYKSLIYISSVFIMLKLDSGIVILVVPNLITSSFVFIYCFYKLQWNYRFGFDKNEFSQMFTFGFATMINGVGNWLCNNMIVLYGSIYSNTMLLGNYSLARRGNNIFTDIFRMPLYKLINPILRSQKYTNEEILSKVIQITKYNSILIAPFLILILNSLYLWFPIIFDLKWNTSVIFLYYLLLHTVVTLVFPPFHNILYTIDRPFISAALVVVRLLFYLTSLIIFIQNNKNYDLLFIIKSLVLFDIFFTVTGALLTIKLLNMKIVDYIMKMTKPLISTIVIFIFTYIMYNMLTLIENSNFINFICISLLNIFLISLFTYFIYKRDIKVIISKIGL